MLRTLLVFGILIPGFCAALVNRHAALLLYLWFALFRPQEYTWVDLSSLKLSLVLGAILIVPALLAGQFPNVSHPLSIGSLLFLALAGVAHLGAVNPAVSWQWLDFMARLILVCLLLVRLTDSTRRLWLTIAVIAGSFGFHTAKAGLDSLLMGGARFTEGFAGAYADNNGYAMACAMLIPLLVITAQNAPRRWIRLAAYAAVPLTAVTIVSTYSRGGFLALGSIVAGYLVLGRRKAVAFAIVALALVAAPLLPVPEGYAERMGTIRTYEQEGEESALSRLHFWRVAIDIAADNVFGVGLFNFERAYDTYDSRSGAFGRGRSVHSSHFQVLAELGVPGLAVWIFLFGYALMTTFRVRRRARQDGFTAADQRFLRTTADGLTLSMVAFLVGGSFLASALNDLTWLTFALVASLDRVSLQMSLSRSETIIEEDATEPGLERSDPHDVMQPASLAGHQG